MDATHSGWQNMTPVRVLLASHDAGVGLVTPYDTHPSLSLSFKFTFSDVQRWIDVLDVFQLSHHLDVYRSRLIKSPRR